jgi:branched-chain amino acid transport system ATP-binding protein
MSANPPKSAPLLDVRTIGIRFGGLKAVDNFKMHLYPGELVGLIGPNGAGKTTCFNMLTGVYQPTSGEIFFDGRSLKGLRPFEISHRGVTRTFQNIRLFKDLTVLDNVLIAMHQHPHYQLATAILRLPRYFTEEDSNRKKALKLLEIFELDRKYNTVASGLPYGEQRKLEIIRALATDPKLILLDEPAAGMNHSETEGLMHTIAKIRREFGLTVLLIEHDMPLVMGICERIFVLDHGVTIAEGDAKSIQNNPKVIEAYLGVAEEEA